MPPAQRPFARKTGFKLKCLALAVAACFAGGPRLLLANPTGATVVNGAASFNTTGSTLSITNSPGAIINWQQFNIAPGETTRFVQQTSQSTVLNRVTGGDPSQILGTLQSNGQVFLINPQGILFGRDAIVDVNKLVASTLNLSDADFIAGRFNFSGGGLGGLVNQGRIGTPLGGSVWLVGSEVRNEGVITTPGGQVLLAAGNSVSLVDTAGPELSVTLSASGNKAINLGSVSAEGGRIDMFGALIEQQGVLAADSASVDAQGRIVLQATDSTTVSGQVSATNSVGTGGEVRVLGKHVTLTGSAQIDVSGASGGGTVLVGGDWQGGNPAVQNALTTTMQAGATIKADATVVGNGGKVVLWADDTTDFKGAISARGGVAGGDGGRVETSGHQHLGLGGTVDTTATQGKTGLWLLDPAIVCIDNAGCAGTYDPTTHGGATGDVWTTATLDAMLQASNVSISVTDYAAFLPNGGTYTLSSAVPDKRTLDIYAPYVYLNGTVDAMTNVAPIGIRLQAGGASASFGAKSGFAELGATANVKLPLPSTPSKDANGYYIPSSYLELQAQTQALLQSGAQFLGQRGTTTYKGWYGDAAIRLNAPTINNLGASVVGSGMSMNFSTFTGSPIQVNIDHLRLGPYSNLDISLGTNTCAGGWCFSDAGQFIAGSLGHLDVGTYYNGTSTTNSISVVGALNPRAGGLSLHTSGGNITIASALSASSWLDVWSDSGAIGVNAPMTSSGNVHVGANGGSITINAPITATYEVDLWSNSGNLGINQPITGGTVDLGTYNGSINLNNTLTATGLGSFTYAYEPYIGIGIDGAGSFNNLVGPTALQAAGERWGMFYAPTATVSLNGLSYKTFDYYSALAAGYPVNDITLQTGPSAYPTPNFTTFTFLAGPGIWITQTPFSDPCVTNPQLCQTTQAEQTALLPTSTGTSAETSTGVLGVTRVESPLNIEATLTVTEPAGTGMPLPAEAPAGAGGGVKPQQVLKQEAEKAKQAAKQAKSEAAEADKQAKQAEAEAKSATTAEAREAAQARAEIKRNEARAKVAEAEAKQAQSEARQAEAEVKVAEAEAKAATTPKQRAEAESKRAEAEVKQAKAQAKQAEAEARQAQAEAKQAETEARSAKAPEQKAVAEKRAEAKQTELDAKKAGAEAKQAQAEAKQAEAEAKNAKTPEQRAQAEQKAEAKKTEAEVKQAQAEAKQSEADGKRAESESRQAKADAKLLKSEGARQVAEKKAEAKAAEGEAKQSEAQAKQAQAEAKQHEAEAKAAKTPEKRAEAEKKAEAKHAEAEKRQTEARAKQAEAEKKAAEHKAAEAKRQEQRKAEVAKAFGKVAASETGKAAQAALIAQRHELKTEILQPALSILQRDPNATALPPCGGGNEVCVPNDGARAQMAQLNAQLPPPPPPTVAFVPQIRRKVALVLGVNNYADGNIPRLESAVPDAEAVGQVLKDNLGYEVRQVKDGTQADIVRAINRLAREVGPNDSVTIYYAGHGYLSEDGKMGYWIPSDGKANSPDKWVSNADVDKLLNAIPAKQVMLVSDSCYAGAFAKGGKVDLGTLTGNPGEILAKRSVTVMSSGGEEPVPDTGKNGHSTFAWHLMEGMKNVSRYDTGARLYETVRDKVTAESPQTPQYGALTASGHDQGADYLLERRSYQ